MCFPFRFFGCFFSPSLFAYRSLCAPYTIAGNLLLGITIHPFLYEQPIQIYLKDHSTTTICLAGHFTQSLNATDCSTSYSLAFAFSVTDGCFAELAPTTINGSGTSVVYSNYETRLELLQQALAPLETAQRRSSRVEETTPPLTTIERQFSRDYTISVATSFTATSQV